MLLVLNADQKEHLTLLTDVDHEIAKEFCRIAVDFIKNGTNTKKYQIAAQKLDFDVKRIRQSIEAIMHILTECSKIQINEIDFKDSVITLGLPDEINECLLEFYLDNRDQIRLVLGDMSLVSPHYENLEWRFDVKLASRMLLNQTTPQVMLKFHIDNGIDKDVHVLQTDPGNLIHLTSVLEEALSEMKTAHCRRIARNIK